MVNGVAEGFGAAVAGVTSLREPAPGGRRAKERGPNPEKPQVWQELSKGGTVQEGEGASHTGGPRWPRGAGFSSKSLFGARGQVSGALPEIALTSAPRYCGLLSSSASGGRFSAHEVLSGRIVLILTLQMGKLRPERIQPARQGKRLELELHLPSPAPVREAVSPGGGR